MKDGCQIRTELFNGVFLTSWSFLFCFYVSVDLLISCDFKSAKLFNHQIASSVLVYQLWSLIYSPHVQSLSNLLSQIKIDGQNIQLVTLESLRKCIGVVPQDTVSFHELLHTVHSLNGIPSFVLINFCSIYPIPDNFWNEKSWYDPVINSKDQDPTNWMRSMNLHANVHLQIQMFDSIVWSIVDAVNVACLKYKEISLALCLVF